MSSIPIPRSPRASQGAFHGKPNNEGQRKNEPACNFDLICGMTDAAESFFKTKSMGEIWIRATGEGSVNASRTKRKEKRKENFENALARSYLNQTTVLVWACFCRFLGGYFLGGADGLTACCFWWVKVLRYILRGWGFKGRLGITLMVELRLSNLGYQVEWRDIF